MRTDDAVSAKSRILIVDDDRLNIMALTAILRVEFELIIAATRRNTGNMNS